MIKFTLNYQEVTSKRDPSSRMLDVLREEFHLFGSKEGCGEGECGACAILLNKRVVNSCLLALGSIEGQSLETIEGFSTTARHAMLVECYEEMGAVQCGFCTPGMLIATESLLSKNPHPSIDEIKIGLAGNLCRCTGYTAIIKAVLLASERGEGLW